MNHFELPSTPLILYPNCGYCSEFRKQLASNWHIMLLASKRAEKVVFIADSSLFGAALEMGFLQCTSFLSQPA
eukprot:5802611-Amphidinium_carterae.1